MFRPGIPKIKLKERRPIVALTIVLGCFLAIFSVIVSHQSPPLFVGSFEIITTPDNEIDPEDCRWILLPKIYGKDKAEDFALVGTGSIEVRLPDGTIESLAARLTPSHDLLEKLNPPPLVAPEPHGELCLIATEASATASIPIEQCQFRVRLDAIDPNQELQSPILEMASRYGFWSPKRDWPTDRVISRIAGTGPYSISSEWSRPTITQYELGRPFITSHVSGSD